MKQHMLSVLGLLAALAASSAAQDFRDDFNSLVLEPGWSWVREDFTHHRLTGSSMQITTQPGALIGSEYNNVRNILLRQPPATTFISETRVTFTPDSMFQNAGLIYYLDDDNYVRVSRGIDGFSNGVWFEWELNGTATLEYVDGITAPTLFLRLSRSNNTFFYASYSFNGNEWYRIGSATIQFVAGQPRIGIQAANGSGSLATPTRIPADFDYYRHMIVTGMENPSAPSDIVLTVHPNPVTQGSIMLVQSSGTGVLQMIDALGRVLFESATIGKEFRTFFSTEDLSPGGYYIRMTTGTGHRTIPVSIVR